LKGPGNIKTAVTGPEAQNSTTEKVFLDRGSASILVEQEVAGTQKKGGRVDRKAKGAP